MAKKKEAQKVSEESVKSEKVVEEVIETPDKTEKADRKFVVVAKHGVNLRKDASLTSDIVKVLEEGTIITTDAHVGEWVQTTEGFVLNKDYILKEQ
jgi:uncharacterized protein YgiM (DUF1202 family)